MKKLFLTLSLFIFSIQGLASSCLDGREPVKSISEDGTYFVFHCEASVDNSDKDDNGITLGESIYKTITQGDPEIYETQMLLNRFGRYSVGKPNGQWTFETQSAVQRFYSDSGQSFNGQWSSKVLSDLQNRRLIVMPRSGSLSFAEKDEMDDQIEFTYNKKSWYELNQIDIDIVTSDEMSPDFCYPTPEDCHKSRLFVPDPHKAIHGDFNGDGLEDLAIAWIYFTHTMKREKTPSHIRFYINDGNNNLISTPEIYALGELPFRHFLYRMTANDFNSDGRDDLFVGSMGVIMRVKGREHSVSDFEPNLLLLSTKDGKMRDASNLIEGQENGGMIQNYTFSHASNSGDINCDGNIDIYSGNALLIGDGTGRFAHQSKDFPSGIDTNSFSSTIADFNGDGCGDIVMHHYGKGTYIWMSQNGKHLPRDFKELKIGNYYPGAKQYVNYMASDDLDGDGDPDLVAAITRLKPYYLGRKLLIFINENGELVEKTNELIQDLRDQDINGIPQNHGEGSIRLIDYDRDGDLDIIDSTGGSDKINGRFGMSIFENDGNAQFTEIPDSEFLVLRYNGPKTGTAYPVDIDGKGRIDYVSFLRSSYSLFSQSVSMYSVLGRVKPVDIESQIKAEKEKKRKALEKKRALEAEQSILNKELEAEIAELDAELEEEFFSNVTSNSKKFESAFTSTNNTVFEGIEKFTKFSSPIQLPSSGAHILGFKDIEVIDENKVNLRAHLRFGAIDFSVGICFEYYSQYSFMAARTSFEMNDWGGLKKLMPSSRCIGQWELNDNKKRLEKIGIYSVIEDLYHSPYELLKAIDQNSEIDLSKIRSFQ
jgi:hypothetical protein